jgi:hypothetical protein
VLQIVSTTLTDCEACWGARSPGADQPNWSQRTGRGLLKP